MNLPNKITLIRVLLVPLLMFIFLFPSFSNIQIPIYHILGSEISLTYILVLIIFSVASFTDYLDGHIARSQNIVTTFGKFIDPIADKLLINTVLLLLANDKVISIIIPLLMISRDMIVDAMRLMAASNNVVVAASNLGKLKTVTQMIGIILILINDFPLGMLPISIGSICIWIAVIVSIISGIDYFYKIRNMIMESM